MYKLITLALATKDCFVVKVPSLTLKLPPTTLVIFPVALSVVNAPVLAVVAPTVMPLIVPPVSVAPLETRVLSVAVDDAPRVVKLPAAGVTLPMMPCSDVAVATPRTGVTRVGLLDSTTFVVPVLVVTPVPPLATAKVPASVTAPVVAVLGVRPVVPAEKLLVTVVADANKVTTPELFL